MRLSNTLFCSACCKPNLEKTMHCQDRNRKLQLCEACASREVLYECTVCHAEKSADCFRANRRDLMRKFPRRCKACESCLDCGRHYPDFRMFAVDSQRCVRCTKAFKLHVCQVCSMNKPESDYPPGSIHHLTSTNHRIDLRCTSCHTCTSCNIYKNQRASCIQCTKKDCQYRCDACGITKDAKLRS